MAKTFRSKKAKGKRAEQQFAAILRKKGIDVNARPMPMSGAMSHFKSDIFTTAPWAIEVKNQERVSLWDWWDQTTSQTVPPKKPLLVVGCNYRPQLCVLRAEDWADLVAENAQLWEEVMTLRDK